MANEYEERLDLINILMRRLDEIALAMNRGEDGSKELSSFQMCIPSDIINPIETEIEKIENKYTEHENTMWKKYTHTEGNPINNRKVTQIPNNELINLYRLKITGNRLIVRKIVDALHKADMVLTKSTRMPSSVMS